MLKLPGIGAGWGAGAPGVINFVNQALCGFAIVLYIFFSFANLFGFLFLKKIKTGC